MKELNNELEINASAERVWHVLTDFASFPQWNPFLQRVSGELTAGRRLDVHTQASGTRGSTSRPTVLKVEPSRELRWFERSLLPGLLNVEHIFTIVSLGTDRVRFTQRAIFTGVFSSLPAGRRNTDTRRGFREMNQALKLRAEQTRPAD